MLLLFCCEPLYYSVTPLLCHWVRFIMATQVNCSSLELIVAFPVFVNAIFAGDGLIYVSSSGEYFECAILLDRLYLGVSSMHVDILFPDTMFCGSTFLRGVQPSLCSSKAIFLINTPRLISVTLRCGFSTILT